MMKFEEPKISVQEIVLVDVITTSVPAVGDQETERD